MITELSIPEGITEIADERFMNCTQLQKVILPEGVAHLGYRAFKHCRNLRQIHLPESLIIIENSVFAGCHQLAYLNIPAHLEKIGTFAFYGCAPFMIFQLSGGLLQVAMNDVYENQSDTDLLKKFLCIQDPALFYRIQTPAYKSAIAFYLVIAGNAEEAICKYAKRNITKRTKLFISLQMPDAIRQLLQTGFITKQNIDKLIQYAIDQQAHECYLVLLDYKNQNIGYQDIMKKFRL